MDGTIVIYAAATLFADRIGGVMVIAIFVVSLLLGLLFTCAAVALFTDDPASATGVIEPGQVW